MSRSFYWRVSVVLIVVLAAWTILWPSIPRIAPPWVQKTVKARMNLGLDIRGGARLSYDVQIGAAIAQRRDRAIESIREQLARDFLILGEGRLTEEKATQLSAKVQIRRNDTDNRELSIRFQDPRDIGKVTRTLLSERNLVERSRTSDTVIAAVSQNEVTQIEESAVREAMKRIESRIDELAVKETSITARGETIVIEIPGSDRAYFDQIQEIIKKTARLEFRICVDRPVQPPSGGPPQDVLQRWATGGELSPRLPAGITVEPEVGVQAGQRADGSTITASPLHFAARGPEGLRQLREFLHSIRDEVPDAYDFLIGEDEREAHRTHTEIPRERKVWRTYTVEHLANVTGDMIRDADVQADPNTGEYYVQIQFKADGARAFGQVTTDNVRKRFAIVLDELVSSAPVINEPIRNGSARITLGTGGLRSAQLKEAQDLAVVLRAGALPAPLSEGTLDFIGPTLGRDTIRSALTAALAGIGLVIFFMAIWYGSAGWIANIAVILNLLLQLAAIALLGATLTLPGFAGLALTVGMAVDSNVLINERIREELRAGKSVRAAVDAGYEHAFTAIFDGHVTTFISGVVLLQYGTGPIKGFAVTLLIGIVANLFTGVFATRIVFDWLVRGLRVKKLSLG